MEFERIDGGVCAAKGFVANGLNCGLNPDKNKNDLALVYSQTECQAAAVTLQNQAIRLRQLLRTAKTQTPVMQMELKKHR